MALPILQEALSTWFFNAVLVTGYPMPGGRRESFYDVLVSECFQGWLTSFDKDCEDLYTTLNSPYVLGR